MKELQDKLQGYISIDFDLSIGQRKMEIFAVPDDIKLQVKSEHLRHMLQEFLDKKLSADELSNWAAFIYMMPYYQPEGETEEDRWEAGEGILWEIIQELVDPNNLTSLEFGKAKDYLKLL
jgi:hypothetical protein